MHLLRILLEKNPKMRISAKNALKHPYFKNLSEFEINSLYDLSDNEGESPA
jgi:serine/threonine protein kinase